MMSSEKIATDSSDTSGAAESEQVGVYTLEANRKSGRLGRFYNDSMTQVALIGMSCFLCPGMFNALSGIGGGGQLNVRVSSRANTALYACFAGVSFFAGTIHNRLGTKFTLFVGACGYSLYIASFLSYNHTQNEGFVVAAGAILGVCASMFWTAQGAVMLSYPLEKDKATAFAIVWVIFNLGGVVGSAIELGLSYNTADPSLGDAPYAVFLVLSFIGACSTLLLKSPSTVIRSDGSRVHVPAQTSWKAEFVGLYRLLRTDYWVVLLFPLFYASNLFYTWQPQDFNAPVFTLRARALNSMLYWGSQMVAAYLFSFVLDSNKLTRRARMWTGWAVVFVFLWAVWGGSYAKQLQYTRADVANGTLVKIDLTMSREYAGPALLYAFSGFFDALWQAYAYSLIGAFSNDISKLAFLAGFYKSLQSAGGATGFAMDTSLEPYMTILAVTWGVCAAGMVIVLPVLYFRITDSTSPLSEISAPGREKEVLKATEEAIKRTGVVPEPLKQMEREEKEAV